MKTEKTMTDTADKFDASRTARKLEGKLSSFVVPCLDEEEALPVFIAELRKAMESMGNPDYEVIFVEDGSTDKTLDVLRAMSVSDPRVRYISFSRNFGKEAAMLAGFKAARGDYVAIMDADLQDPPSLLPLMYEKLLSGGCDCVATRRSNRMGEGFFRSFFSNLYYALINRFSDVKLVSGARDYRLMTRRVVDAVLSLPEHNRFTKGIYEWVGFRTEWISYPNVKRSAGRTKWSFFGLFLYAVEGLTAFSTVPLAIASVMGLLFCALSSLAIVFIIVRQLLYHNSAYGWSSMMCVIIFLSGLQLMCLGVIGQYLAKSYLETKRRPVYIIKEQSPRD